MKMKTSRDCGRDKAETFCWNKYKEINNMKTQVVEMQIVEVRRRIKQLRNLYNLRTKNESEI